MTNNNSSIRNPILIIAIFGLTLVVILARLLYLSVIVADEYNADAKETRNRIYTIPAKRGTIYDRNGNILAVSVEKTNISCDPTEIEDANDIAEKLVNSLGGTKDDYIQSLTKENTRFSYVKKLVDVENANKLKEIKKSDANELKGVFFETVYKREYPNGSIGGQIVGYCGSDGDGICGLELYYNDELKGEDGEYAGEKGLFESPIPDSVEVNKQAKDGEDLMISIDINLQAQVEERVSKEVENIGGKRGNATIMDSSTGEIYAMCSTPYFNPADTENSETGSDAVSPIVQSLEPGSVMKTVTAMGILDQGAMTMNDAVMCPLVLNADEYEITDARERSAGNMTLDQIITISSNIGISLCSDKIGARGIANNLKKSRLLQKTGVDFPGETAGFVDDYSSWSNIQRYNVTFGQGIVVTPLEMLTFYSGICQDGTTPTPHFLISKPQTSESPTYDKHELGYSKDSLSQMNEMLRHVVENNASSRARIDGYEVCGKTATAEYTENGKYVKGRYNLAFCGYLKNATTNFSCYVGVTEVGIETGLTGMFSDIMKFAIDSYRVVPNAN